jgi:hypothetical protein
MAVASFPEVHITGPVHHYIQAIGGQIYYLGTAEVTPQIQVRRYRSNTMNDVAGKTLPLQKTWDGEAAVVSVLLTNFSKFAEQELQTSGRTNGVQLTERAGIETRWARGSAVYGKSTFKLWQVYDNFFNPFGTSTGLEIGWYWPQVELLQRDTVKAGSQGEGLLCVFDCTPYRIPQASPTAVNDTLNERGWFLYSQDDNTTDFPASVRVPQ